MKISGIIVTSVLVYIAAVIFMYVMQRNLTYFPDKTTPVPAHYGVPQAQTVTVKTADGIDLTGWYIAPKSADKPVILMFHGNAGHIGIRAFKMLPYIQAGYGFLLAEYRGYGGNAGEPTEDNLYKDGRAYLSHLLEQLNGDMARIVLYGESLGTGVAVQLASETKGLGGLILETPYTSLPAVGQSYYFFMPVKLLMKDKLDSLSKIGEITAPLLILHGEKDMIVPYKFGRKLFEAAPAPKHMETFPRGGHNDLYFHGAGPKAVQFLDEIFK